MNLNIGRWKEFRLADVFIVKGGFYNKKPEHEVEGSIPFLASTESNNGVTEYYSINDIRKWDKTGNIDNTLSKKIYKGNCIAVTVNGSVCNAFYQADDFTCSHDITVLYPIDHTFTKLQALFICTVIMKEKYRWSYGRKPHDVKKFGKSIIKLPVTQNDEINWDFMEQYIKSLNHKPLTTQNRSAQHSLDIDSWQEFCLNDILDIKRGESIYINASEIGATPYASASAEDNGISAYIDIKPNREGNCLSINYDGSVGEAYYHAKPFFASEKIVTATLKKHQMNQYIALFLTTIIKMEKYRFSYGRKWTVESSMKKSVIKLPIIFNTDGTPYVKKELGYSLEGYVPDWEFMENYIKSLPYGDRI